ncbi:MAG: 5'/3'-nucleotidase SurE, partial [Verrucomicrobiota bacterium]
GFDGPGLAALYHALKPLGHVEVAAPAVCHSAKGHAVNTNQPIRVVKRSVEPFGEIQIIESTPADCVRVAITKLLPTEPDWVFSGINHGGNLGQDIYISGTVAAAREAAYHGLRAAAFSHYMKRGLELDWETATQRVAALFQQLLAKELKPGELWNVNLPHLPPGADEPGFYHTEPEPAPLGVSYEETPEGLLYDAPYAERERQPGSDVDVCFGGEVSLTRLEIDGYNPKSSWRLRSRDLAIQAVSAARNWELLGKPASPAPYFEWSGDLPHFDPTASTYNDVNAWWLAEISRITYTRVKGEIVWRGEDPVRAENLAAVGVEQLASFYSAGSHVGIFRLTRTTTGQPCIVVGFRGTNNLLQWMLNLTVLGEPWADEELGEDAKVHQGFRYIFDNLWPKVEAALPDTDEPVFYTGHSLGGALSVLATIRRKPFSLYTFGAPRVGNDALLQLLDGTPYHRVVFHHDIVSIVPKTTGRRTGLIYKHGGTLHYLTPDNRLLVGEGHADLGDDSWQPESPAQFLREAFEAAGAQPPQPLTDHMPINYTRVLRARIQGD